MTQIKVQYVLNNMTNGLREKHSVQSLNLGKSPPPWKRQSSLWPVPSWVVVALQTWSMCRRGWVSSAVGDSMNQLHGTGTQNRVLATSTVASSRYGALSHSTTLLHYWLPLLVLMASFWHDQFGAGSTKRFPKAHTQETITRAKKTIYNEESSILEKRGMSKICVIKWQDGSTVFCSSPALSRWQGVILLSSLYILALCQVNPAAFSLFISFWFFVVVLPMFFSERY